MDIYIFGAGASAAEGAPTMAGFLAYAWEQFSKNGDERIEAVWRFLESLFQVPITEKASFELIPPVDEVISLMDWSVQMNQGLGYWYDVPRLIEVRRDLEYLLCITLQSAMQNRTLGESGPYGRFVSCLARQDWFERVTLLSLNYDTLLDEALIDAGLTPDYGLDGASQSKRPSILVAKLHGSLNWARCSACDQVEAGGGVAAHLLAGNDRYACRRCGNQDLQGMIISPTWLKSYQGAQLQQIWRRALHVLQQARRIIFVGYSMPPADIAIYHLLKRGLLAHRSAESVQFEVISHRSSNCPPTEQALRMASLQARFTRLFGRRITFDFSGFRGQILAGYEPLDDMKRP